MKTSRWLRLSDRWSSLLLRWYPDGFREEMGRSFREAYRDQARTALAQRGELGVLRVWLVGFWDALRNGLAERWRPGIRWRRTGQWGRDTERVVRRLTRAPLFTLSVVGTLTVGLGGFAVVAAVVNRVLLAPLPYQQPDDLYYVWRDYTWVPFLRGWLGGTDVAALQRAGGSIAGAVGLQRNRMTLSAGSPADGAEPEEIGVMVSSPGLFDLLGVHPKLGRSFAADEAGPGRPARMVLSHQLWRRWFQGDLAVLGREARLNGTPFTVIGVMGPEFEFVRHASIGPPEGAEAYITFDIDLAETNPGSGSFAGLIRAAPGTALPVLAGEVGAVARLLDERDFRSLGLELQLVQIEEDLVAAIRPALLVLGAAAGVLVLVLAVNLASLLLIRAAEREREYAVARALGANPAALARATLLEGALLGLLGGAGGVVAATWGLRAMVTMAPLDLPRRETIAMDLPMAAVVVGVGLLLGTLAGVVPATWVTRTRLMHLLANTAVRGGGAQSRIRRTMVTAQVALSLLLLTTGGLVVRSFGHLLRSDPGFEPMEVLTFRVPVPASRAPEAADVLALHQRVEAALRDLPGVTAVGAVMGLPLTAGVNQAGIALPGAPGNQGDRERDHPLADYTPVTSGYFAAMGIQVLAGRGFTGARLPGRQEVVIDRTLAAAFYPTGSPIGAMLLLDGDTTVVVGVVEHARQYDLHADGRYQVYVRHEDFAVRAMSYAVRTTRRPLSLVPDVRRTLREIDAELAVSQVQPMGQVVGEAVREQRLSAVLIAGFSVGALLLAAMGLFGVVAGSVNRRRHELAVRLALGATGGSVVRLVLGEGTRLVVLGILVAVPGIYLVGRLLRGTLIGVSPFDLPTLLAVAAGLGATALVACWLPARRVGRIEPARALRDE